MKYKVCFTGGGTAGHALPNKFIYEALEKPDAFYIGSSGIEKEILSPEMKYFEIRSGKLRRYFSFRNFVDVGNIVIGFMQSFLILIKNRPSLVFSKGGFVCVPVCYAAWLLKIPVITHESDFTPGLATKLVAKIADKVLCTFESSCVFKNSVFVGAIVRTDIKNGDKERGAKFCGFDQDKKTLLVMGGSLGAKNLNEAVFAKLKELCESYQVVHICGKGKVSEIRQDGYKSFSYLNQELIDVLALADVVISRAGANAIFEFLFLKKAMILVPLEAGSRGDQILNANFFEKKGWAKVLRESELQEKLMVELENVKASNPEQKYLDGLVSVVSLVKNYI